MSNEDGLIVFIDGVYQADNVYSVSGTTLTFATAPVNTRVIEVFQLEGGIVGVSPVIATMTGDGSDTTLALGTSPDSENQTFVTIDGVVQHKDTYSISGSTLTFSAAPPNGTSVEAVIFNNVSVATFQDADGDTKIQLEESSDEDKIRFDIAGTEEMVMDASGIVINDGSNDRDFRIESNGDTHMLFVDGGNDRVGIKQSSPLYELDVNGEAYIRTRIFAGDGTASSPSVRFFNASTGLYHPGSDALGIVTSGSEAIRIDSAGHVTKPLQTAVLVSKSSSQLNIAVDSGVTHVFDNEQFDVNGDFASNTFTAPVTGKYLVCLQVRWQNIPTNINYIQTWLATSNGTRYMGLFGSGTDLFNNDCDYYRDSQSIIIDMDANDTFTVSSQQSSGTQQTDIGQESYLSVALLS